MTASPGVTAPSGARGRWWHREVGYEVYLRSFADGDGDGVGDLAGVTSRLDELAWLGVGIIWITPCTRSPMRDHGYDVSDHYTVEPVYGDLVGYRELCAAAAARGIRVLTDLVPNHTSSEHRWFTEARRSRDNPYRDYYLWADPAEDGGPPNNWVSHFGGPAWTRDEATGQHWCHLFLPEQPDLNWRSEAVREEFDRILRHWVEVGSSGFRLDVAHALTKHPDLPDLPPAPPDAPRFMGRAFEDLLHVHDLDQPDNVEVHRRWRTVAEESDSLLVGEVYVLEPDRLRRYLDPPDGLHLAFWFPPLHIGWSAPEVRRVLADGASLPPGRLAWITGSHDRPRAASRYGGGDLGRQRAMTMQVLQWGLPGVPWIYQGEELGLDNARLSIEEMHDAFAVRNPEKAATMSRDLARTPMPWAPGEGLGFTPPGVEPWLAFGGRTEAETWAVQREDRFSWLRAWRRLVRAWRRLPADLPDAVTWSGGGDVVDYRRGPLRVVANLGDGRVEIAADRPATLAFHRDPDLHGREVPTDGVVLLGPAESAWLVHT